MQQGWTRAKLLRDDIKTRGIGHIHSLIRRHGMTGRATRKCDALAILGVAGNRSLRNEERANCKTYAYRFHASLQASAAGRPRFRLDRNGRNLAAPAQEATGSWLRL